jgi:hypothetical protein
MISHCSWESVVQTSCAGLIFAMTADTWLPRFHHKFCKQVDLIPTAFGLKIFQKREGTMAAVPTRSERIAIHCIHILFGGDERLLQLFFHHKELRLRESPEDLLSEARALSRGEFLLVQVAMDLWCGEGKTNLSDLLTSLDEGNFLRVLQALAYKREMVEAWEALSCCE